MRTHTDRELATHGSRLALTGLTLLALSHASAHAQATLTEDFESYPQGLWPDPDWVSGADASTYPAMNLIAPNPVNPGMDRVLQLHSPPGNCTSAPGFRFYDFPDTYTLRLRVRNGDEATGPCQDIRAEFGMSIAAAPSTQRRTLLYFRADGRMLATDGSILPVPYQTDTWHRIRVEYDRVGTVLTVGYWVDTQHAATVVTILPNPTVDTELDYLYLSVQEGTALYDDIELFDYLDCNANGIPDEEEIASGDAQDCNLNEVPDLCEISDGSAEDLNFNDVPDECECTANPYCSHAPNSTGVKARIEHTGSLDIDLNTFRLHARNCPLGQPGLFYYGGNAIELPFGDGYRCVGGGTHRIGVAYVDSNGVASIHVDFTLQPMASGPGQIDPVSTWHFQFWYRDPAAGGAGFNFSNGLRVTFCP